MDKFVDWMSQHEHPSGKEEANGVPKSAESQMSMGFAVCKSEMTIKLRAQLMHAAEASHSSLDTD